MKRAISTIVFITMLFGISLAGTIVNPDNRYFRLHFPKHEVRAVWLTTIGGLDWPRTYARTPEGIKRQKEELIGILDALKRANINTVLFQTRIRGTVIFPSRYEPWDGCMSGVPGKSPGYDPLPFAVEECHKRGMEIQAWVVAVPVGKWNGYGCKSLRAVHPSLLVKDKGEGYLNPALPQAAQYLSDICREIAERYDIDGIHLDYIRYPENMRLDISRTKARENITRMVRSVHGAVKTIKPWVKISCSPIGKFNDVSRYSSRGWNAFDKGCQDVEVWMKEGLVDQIYPMMYFRDNQFFPFAADWLERSCGKTVVPGLGIYFLSPREADWHLSDITRQMYTLRDMGMGYAFFRSRFFTDNTKGLYDFTSRHFNIHPSLVPPMTCYDLEPPLAPKELTVTRIAGYDIVKWNDGTDRSRSPYLTYNVYASACYPVDTDNAANILAVRLRDNEIAVDNDKGHKLYYAVTAADRYGNESSALQLAVSRPSTASARMITNDGTYLQLPPKGTSLDAPYIIIETLEGSGIATIPYRGSRADIRRIPEGMYVLRSLNGKGVTHRLGYTLIKR